MSSDYKTEERIIKDIISNNVKPTDPEQELTLIIYYKSKKTSQLLMKNKRQAEAVPLREDHVVYEHTCTIEGCGPQTYIGMTCTTLSRRLTCHLQNGAIKQHHSNLHRTIPTRKELEDGTTIVDRKRDPRRLLFLEALYIAEREPSMNMQTNDLQVLPSLKRKPRIENGKPGR